MEPISVNPAAVQFVRKKTQETRFLVLSFIAVLLIGAITVLYILRNQKDQPVAARQVTELIQGVPSYAQMVVVSPSVSVPEVMLIKLPGVSIVSIARWEELTEGREIAAEMFSASRSAQEMASGIEMFAGAVGYSLSSRRSSSIDISYTFYKDGRIGTLSITPLSASTSRITIKL